VLASHSRGVDRQSHTGIIFIVYFSVDDYSLLITEIYLFIVHFYVY